MKNLPTKLVNLTEINKQYYDDLHRFICVAAGRRSRKDLIGVRKLLVDPERGAFNLPGHTFIFAAPTRQQAKAIFWATLKKDTKLFQKSRPMETELKIELMNGSLLMVTGLDKPERIEGITFPPIKAILITELPNCKPEVWGEHIRPILSDNDGWAILNGVPEGMNHWYARCLYAAGGSIPNPSEGHGVFVENTDDPEWCFYSWFSADVLPAKEIEAAKREYDEKTYRQEYEASFESDAGLAYYAFSQKNIGECNYNPSINLDIGMDFNVNPMCSVEGHLRDGAYYQHSESVLINSNTQEMIEHIIEKYRLIKNRNGLYDVTIYPDATGAARETNATFTDLQLLRRAGFTVKARKSNPLQRDRINSLNAAMKPMMGTPKYFIDPSCKNTIDDYAKVQRLADGRLDKNQEEIGKSRVHISDACGYLIDYYFPIHKHNLWS